MKAWTCCALVLAACEPEARCPPATLAPPAEQATLAVITSDYSSTAVSLLAADGALITEAILDSGTRVTATGPALSGDVVLPTAPLEPGTLTLIDRLGVDVVTRIDLVTGAPIQLRTQRGGTGGYRANPQDALRLDSGELLASRFEPNRSPDIDPLDAGNDLVIIDSDAREPIDRIDLAPFDEDMGGVHVFARPSRMARIGAGSVVVGLARLSGSFMETGRGAVALVDLERRTAELFPLEGASNCAQAAPIPGTTDTVMVLCAGPTFTDEPGRRSGAAVFALTLDGDALTVAARFAAADHATDPVPDAALVPLDAERALAIASGDRRTGTSDRLLLVDLNSAVVSVVLESSPFSLGQGALDPRTGIVYVADAERGLRRFAADSLIELDPIDVSPCRALPPRSVGLIE